ncbi:MAG: hypothetical protein A2Z83_02670 [Omnitrophica bacterium GWA2_52_8]|nr:MAG: hypothetical protein A2Z83_02670 [Omnitrophica bacterium GWA2_52_8]
MDKYSKSIAFVASIVYFSQGALGIASIVLPLHLRSLDLSVGQIATLSSLAAAPWVAKIIYGLLSDSYPLWGYRRKSYLALCSMLSAAGWVFLVVLPPSWHCLLISLMIGNLGFAAMDVVTDGLIVEHSTRETSPVYQGIAWGTRSLGAFLTGLSGGWLAQHWVARDVFLLTATLPLAVFLAVNGILKEKPSPAVPAIQIIESLKQCFRLLLLPNLMWFVGILIFSSTASIFGVPFFFYMKETLGFSETFLGGLISLGWAGALAGSIFYARVLKRISPKKTLYWAIALNSINIFSTLLIFDRRTAFVLSVMGGILLCLTLIPVMSSAALLATHSGVEGTLFAVLMSIYNLGQIGFGYLGGHVYHITGVKVLILIAGLTTLGGLFCVKMLNLKYLKPAV